MDDSTPARRLGRYYLLPPGQPRHFMRTPLLLLLLLVLLKREREGVGRDAAAVSQVIRFTAHAAGHPPVHPQAIRLRVHVLLAVKDPDALR